MTHKIITHTAENAIFLIDGRAFASMNHLTEVRLSNNDCIDQDFTTSIEIAEMSVIVNEKCSLTMEYLLKRITRLERKLEEEYQKMGQEEHTNNGDQSLSLEGSFSSSFSIKGSFKEP